MHDAAVGALHTVYHQSVGRTREIRPDKEHVVEGRKEETNNSRKSWIWPLNKCVRVFLTHTPVTTSEAGLKDIISIGFAVVSLKADR